MATNIMRTKPRVKGYPELWSGPKAAAVYLTRRKVSAAHGSSLRKLRRMFRIDAGLRPLCYGKPEHRRAA